MQKVNVSQAYMVALRKVADGPGVGATGGVPRQVPDAPPAKTQTPAASVANPPTAPEQLGPWSRAVQSGVNWLGNTFGWKGANEHYLKNRNLWDTGAGLATALGGAGILKSMSSAFDDDDDDDRPRRRRGGSGFGNAMSWLAPMALIGGGIWAWNKYGDDIKRGIAAGRAYKKLPGSVRKLADMYMNLQQNPNQQELKK